MGTMVGDVDELGTQIGVAPGARWIGCRNMESGFGTPTTYAECFQFFLAPTDLAGSNTNPALAPHVINNSWGCPENEGCTETTWGMIRTVQQSLRAAGVLVVASAGNNGSACGSTLYPIGTYDASYSIGAVNAGGDIAPFSSRGPVTFNGTGISKPDISAPGVAVRSAYSIITSGTISPFATTTAAISLENR
jgi:subtilisin family serine protease